MKQIITQKGFKNLKRQLIQKEKENTNQIILIPRAGEKEKDSNWYEIAEHSALIYYHKILKPLGEEVKFAEDINSYYERYETGLICTNGENKVRLLLKKARLYKSEKSAGGYYIFKLNKSFTEKEIEELKNLELERRKEGNEIIKITFSDPELFRDLRLAARDLHRVCNDHFNKLASRTNGVRMVELIDKILNNYQLLSTKKDRKAFWLKIYQDLKMLAIEVQTAIHAEIMDSSDGIKVVASLKPIYIKIEKIVKGLE